MSFHRSLVKMAAEEEKMTGHSSIQDLFNGEDKRRLICPKCSHVQIIFQNFCEVGLVSIGLPLRVQ